MFKEELIEEKDSYKVIISIEKRIYTTDKKLIYQGNPSLLIPESCRQDVELKSAPTLQISNMNLPQYTNVGVWIFLKKKKPKRRTRAKKILDK